MQHKIVIALIVFIAIGLAFFFLYGQQQSQPVEGDFEPDLGPVPGVVVEPGNLAPTSGNCASQATQEDKDLCWSWQAGDEKNVRLCDNIKGEPGAGGTINESKKVICIEAVAIELLDEGICKQELNENNDWMYDCITVVAREKMDDGLCNAMPSPYKEKCITALQEEGSGTPSWG
jgi:hypothetical protein